MKKHYFAAIFIAVALAGASTQILAQNKEAAKGTAIEKADASFVLISPINGEVLRGGQQVQVIWELTLDKAIAENPWGEMEFFLDTDEGVHMRITPQLSLNARSFTLTIP